MSTFKNGEKASEKPQIESERPGVLAAGVGPSKKRSRPCTAQLPTTSPGCCRAVITTAGLPPLSFLHLYSPWALLSDIYNICVLYTYCIYIYYIFIFII